MWNDRRELQAIFAGGALGGAARTGLSELAPTHAGHWPWVTFTVNVIGCFILGYFVTRLQERLPVTAYRRPLLGTGLCGALTTFSTFQLELLNMLDRGDVPLAVLYCAGSVSAGLSGLARNRCASGEASGRTTLIVCVCAGIGAVARFLLDGFVESRLLNEFPFGTLAVNLGGCFLLGLLVGLDASHRTMELLGTATLGSYTTFSTWMLETHRPAEDRDPRMAWQNVAVSLAAGLGAAALGRWIGGLL